MTVLLARFQARVLLRGRATLVSLVLFVAVTTVATIVGLGSFRQVGLGSVGPAAAALVNLALLLPTAQAILVGALTMTGDRESGFRAMLTARGVGSAAVASATWLAVTAVVWLSILAGFAAAAVVLAGNVPTADLLVFLGLLAVTLLAAAAAAAVGILVGSLAGTRVQAALGGVAAWFVLAIAFDLAVVGLGAFLRFGEAAILLAVVADPLTAARAGALLLLDADGGVLGPLGQYLLARLGPDGSIALLGAAVAAWTAVPLALATVVLRRRDG